MRASEALLRDVADAIAACADWHGTPEVRLRRTVPSAASKAMAAWLRRGRVRG